VIRVALDGQWKMADVPAAFRAGLAAGRPAADRSMRDRKLLRRRPDELVVHADLSGMAAGHLNDMWWTRGARPTWATSAST
jgi:hypothetical protein